MKSVRLGLVGCGLMGNCYAAVFPRDIDSQIVACCDPSLEKLGKFGNKWIIKNRYTNYKDLIDTEKIDILLNATPDSLHYPVSQMALKKGIPVFSEKPMTSNYNQSESLCLLAENQKILTGINFSKRNSSALIKASKLIKNGNLGSITHLEATYKQGWIITEDFGSWKDPDDHSWTWRLSSEHQPLGVLGDLGSHLYDIAEYLLGPISEISTKLNRFPREMTTFGNYKLDSYDSFNSMLNFKNGAGGFLHGTRCAAGEVDSLLVSVYGTEGSIKIDYSKKQELQIFHAKSRKWETQTLGKPLNQYQSFINSFKKGIPYQPDYNTGKRNQFLLDSSLESHLKKKTIIVNP